MFKKYDVEYLIELVEDNIEQNKLYLYHQAHTDFDIAMANEGLEYKKNILKKLKKMLDKTN